ncbi:hypothetical protein HYPSUDRAFT_35109 [Hypholoma sublateritium FD-334 SS-4]|uniref:AN1-type domain-containing protein n=1 Tax=Hypholoma sublateritium (strain FD-334 SS-4) TaxID=945553 RepID=A0A0D2Q6I4_HYPSF|nr:hypothetical protein HYPSUDRAFT_35109 [Hypholoma sublateritium FD-334 SS-4]
MDLPQIGAHCALPFCNVLDFLPITCKCQRSFCTTHILADRHDCPLLTANIVTADLPKSSEQLPHCAHHACQKISLKETCQACTKSFCVGHRHAEMHECPSLNAEKEETPPMIQKPVAKPKLASKKPPGDPAKYAQWQKVQTMRMRHRATPADPKDKTASLPPDQRLHVRISVAETEHIFWLRKTVVTGRALDLIAKQLKLTYSDAQPLKLCLVSQTEEQPDLLLQNDQVLASQVMDGCTLTLSRIKP